MIRKFTVFYFLIIANAFAGNDNYATGARSTALANTSVCLSDVWSNSNNQAGLATLKSTEVGVFAERKFLLSQAGLNAAAVAARHPVSFDNLFLF